MSGAFTPEHRIELKLADGLAIVPALLEIEVCKGDEKLTKKFGEQLMRLRQEPAATKFASFSDVITAMSRRGFPRYRITFGNHRPRA